MKKFTELLKEFYSEHKSELLSISEIEKLSEKTFSFSPFAGSAGYIKELKALLSTENVLFGFKGGVLITDTCWYFAGSMKMKQQLLKFTYKQFSTIAGQNKKFTEYGKFVVDGNLVGHESKDYAFQFELYEKLKNKIEGYSDGNPSIITEERLKEEAEKQVDKRKIGAEDKAKTDTGAMPKETKAEDKAKTDTGAVPKETKAEAKAKAETGTMPKATKAEDKAKAETGAMPKETKAEDKAKAKAKAEASAWAKKKADHQKGVSTAKTWLFFPCLMLVLSFFIDMPIIVGLVIVGYAIWVFKKPGRKIDARIMTTGALLLLSFFITGESFSDEGDFKNTRWVADFGAVGKRTLGLQKNGKCWSHYSKGSRIWSRCDGYWSFKDGAIFIDYIGNISGACNDEKLIYEDKYLKDSGIKYKFDKSF